MPGTRARPTTLHIRTVLRKELPEKGSPDKEVWATCQGSPPRWVRRTRRKVHSCHLCSSLVGLGFAAGSCTNSSTCRDTDSPVVTGKCLGNRTINSTHVRSKTIHEPAHRRNIIKPESRCTNAFHSSLKQVLPGLVNDDKESEIHQNM